MKILSASGARALFSEQLRFIGTFNLKRFVNYGKLFFSYSVSSLLRKPIHWGLPWAVSVEPTTFCNLHCPECPSGTGKLKRQQGAMNLDAFKKLLSKIPPETTWLTFYFQGEPFLNKYFFEMVSLAKQRRMFVSSSTNGHFLNAENAKKTIASGLDRLIVSLDGADSETYLKYRKGGDFEKVITGIQTLSNLKRGLKTHLPLIVLQFLVFRQNEHQLSDIAALGKQLGADVLEFKTAQHHDPGSENAYVTTLDKFSRYRQDKNGKYLIKRKMRNRCWRMWSSCVITWDGKVVPCCYDKDAAFCYGNLNQSDFMQIWRGKHAQAFRKKLIKDRKEIEICRNCAG